MAPTLYYLDICPSCRSVRLALRGMGITVNEKHVDTEKKEHHTPEFTKLNPQRTVPVLEDGGFALSENRPILMYLADKYAKNDQFYPKDLQKRALVNHRFFFDIGTIYQALIDAYYSVFKGERTFDQARVDKLTSVLNVADSYLSNTKWVAGDHLTIADYSWVSSISSVDGFGYDLTQHPNLHRWYKQCQNNMTDYAEMNQKYVEKMREKIANNPHLAGKLQNQQK